MARSELAMALLVVVLAAGCCAPAAAVAYLSKLPVTLDVTASPSPGQGTSVAYASHGLVLTKTENGNKDLLNAND